MKSMDNNIPKSRVVTGTTLTEAVELWKFFKRPMHTYAHGFIPEAKQLRQIVIHSRAGSVIKCPELTKEDLIARDWEEVQL